MSWTVICTHPNKERVAIENLKRQGFEVYCPWVQKRRSHARKVETVLRPLFPGYIFMKLEEEKSMRSVRSTMGVRQMICFGDKPGKLPNAFIETLKEKEIEGVIPPAPLSQRLPEGSKVRVMSGAFKDFMATVLSCGAQDRVIVLLDLLKRSVRMEVPETYLERA